MTATCARMHQRRLLLAAAALATALAAHAPMRAMGERPAMPRQYAEAAQREYAEPDSAVRPLWRAQFDRSQQAQSLRAPVWVPETIGGDAFDAPPVQQQHLMTTTATTTAVLTAYPPRLRDGEDLVVRWSGVTAPHAKDYLALSCGPTAHARDALAEVSVSHADDDAVRFPQLYMLRCDYVVVYYNYQPHAVGDDGFVALASVQVGMTEPFSAPKHGHIALTEHADELVVMFNSASTRTPHVRYGRDAAALTQSAAGMSSTYSAGDMCHAPANETAQARFRDPGYMHKVLLRGLARGARYFYQFGNAHDGWSAVYSFKTRPADADVAARKVTTKFLAYADMGVDSAPAATSTAARAFADVMGNGFDDFLLHFGDVSYARGQGFVWDAFFHVIEPYATRVPYMVSIGNHEYDYMEGGGGSHDPSGAVDPATGRMAFHPAWGNFGGDSSGECSVPMFHRWHAPATGHGIYWYAFDYGTVHVIQLSSEHDWTRGSAQFAWLEADLQRVDRTRTPWVVLTAHRMMYTTQLGEEPDRMVSLRMREELEPLLWTYKVNAMLVGHQHSYERSCAVRAGECTRDGVGPVHIVVGSAGASLETQGFSRDLGNWSVSHINDWGYLRVEASADSMMMQFVLNRNGAVYDEVTLAPWL